MDKPLAFDHQALLALADMRMPFGKYAGHRLIDRPEPYVVWFARQGFPAVPLGSGLNPRFSPDGTTAAARLLTKPPQVALHPIGTGKSRQLPVGDIVNLGLCYIRDTQERKMRSA